MKNLIIYDNLGKIYITQSNLYDIPKGGIQYIETEVPDGKYVKSIDITVTPNVAILEDIPKSETEIMQEQLLATQAELANLKEQLLLK